MKKLLLVMALSFPLALFAQAPGKTEGTETQPAAGKEIPNKVSAVREANPGDYILLPSGKKYILTREEIAIVKGEFDYEDLTLVRTEILDDGTEVKTITQAHIAYVYPDGQSTHILKTSVSFSAFMRHIQEKFFLASFIDVEGEPHDFIDIDPPSFDVFRASVQFQTVSDGIEELQALDVTVYNYDGENFLIKYCSKPDMVWGHISDKGVYRPIGESHKIEFDIE